MDPTILQVIGVIITLGAAIYAGRQANYAKEQANSAKKQADYAKDANQILHTEMKRKVIDQCIEHHKHKADYVF